MNKKLALFIVNYIFLSGCGLLPLVSIVNSPTSQKVNEQPVTIYGPQKTQGSTASIPSTITESLKPQVATPLPSIDPKKKQEQDYIDYLDREWQNCVLAKGEYRSSPISGGSWSQTDISEHRKLAQELCKIAKDEILASFKKTGKEIYIPGNTW